MGELTLTAKKSKKGTCTYCGKLKTLTRDHIIPKCLFPAPLPAVMVTVPACHDCNNEKSKHDDYLRDMLVVDSNTGENEIAQEMSLGKVRRSASRNLSAVIRAAKTQGRFQPVHSKGGIYLGHAFTFPLEVDRVNHIFSQIVRGLYFRLTKRYLPQDCSFVVRRITAREFNEFWPELEGIGYNGPYRLGDDIFSCLFIYAAEEPAISQWWLWFYGHNICVMVRTAPATYDIQTLQAAAT